MLADVIWEVLVLRDAVIEMLVLRDAVRQFCLGRQGSFADLCQGLLRGESVRVRQLGSSRDALRFGRGGHERTERDEQDEEGHQAPLRELPPRGGGWVPTRPR